MEELIKKAERKVVGTKQTLKALEKGEVSMVIIARDAEDKVIRPVLLLCEANKIELHYVDSMVQLGRMCGIKVKAAVAAITE
ncbi:MAG: ribosomal L7Ae/L30e/S12e/Gadd45 family protein [Bacillota bacterium]|nr:ribosomal L7Ae/L30e/S12e/Gadd45 family protein [Bacillota bacterium]MDW7730541.1 ribosomal L7Ae/L30e/S12e/Gadd45 family protein [Bacillota bacterium]